MHAYRNKRYNRQGKQHYEFRRLGSRIFEGCQSGKNHSNQTHVVVSMQVRYINATKTAEDLVGLLKTKYSDHLTGRGLSTIHQKTAIFPATQKH
jgi:hypothetical protein